MAIRRWREGAITAVMVWGIGLHGWAAAAGSNPQCPTRPVRVAFADAGIPPYLNGSGSRFQAEDPGMLVEEAQRAFQRLGCVAEFVRLPQRRIERSLSTGDVDLAMGFGDTPDRRVRWQFPQTPDGALSLRHSLARSPIQWLVLQHRRATLEARWQAGNLGGRLGVVPDSVASRLLAQRGIPAAAVEYPDRILVLVERERFDAIAIPVAAYQPQLQAQADRFALLQPVLGHVEYFAPASQAFFRAHPEFTWRAWEALCIEARKRASLPGCLP